MLDGSFAVGKQIGMEVTGYPVENPGVTNTSGGHTDSPAVDPTQAGQKFTIPPWLWIFAAVVLGYFGMRMLVQE